MKLFTRTRTYLDWASAAPVHPRAKEAFLEAISVFGNPSSPHEEGRQSHELLESLRTRVARLASVKSDAVIFTSGATEANNLAIRGRADACMKAGIPYTSQHILYVPSTHASVRETIASLESLGVSSEPLELENGQVSLRRLVKQLRPETILVCVDAVCGEAGIRFDTRRIAQTLKESGARYAHLHVDASQLPLTDSIERMRLKADLITLDAQKVGGVRGVGALIVPDSRSVHPILKGGGQEGGLRPGTEPLQLIAAFAAALEAAQEGYELFQQRAAADREALMALLKTELPDLHITEGKQQVPHILNLSLPGLDTDYAVMLMSEEGFAISTKSACETDSEAGSRAVLLHTGDERLAASTLRISWGPETTRSELLRAGKALVRTTRFLA